MNRMNDKDEMNWTVLIPLNAPGRRKSRLAQILSPEQRDALARQMHRHVLQCAERAPQLQTILTFSPIALARPHWRQRGHELNAELGRARSLLRENLLVLNADLPLLEPGDLSVLVAAAADNGCALAPDRHGTGTNAVALRADASFEFRFGVGSLAAHLRAAPTACVVYRAGLAFDLDTPADLAHLRDARDPLPPMPERSLRPCDLSAAWAYAD